MPSSLLTHLRALVVTASEPHVGVTWRRMFGCDAAFVRDHIRDFVAHHESARGGDVQPTPLAQLHVGPHPTGHDSRFRDPAGPPPL